MNKSKMPVIFTGHGSPMIALEHNYITEEMAKVGQFILHNHGRPKAILAISGHWYTNGSFVQSEETPRQIYDMYGFPDELYEVKYPVNGDIELTKEVERILGDVVSVNNDWGIDHGSWTVLVHMFPSADIPVVQLSVNAKLDTRESYELGRKLALLREEGYLILGSGNVVHNLRRAEWDNDGGSKMTIRFNKQITDAIIQKDIDTVINYKALSDASYAVPTPDHFLPLLYCLGAAGNYDVEVFNNVCNLGSIAMTGYIFS